MPDRAGTGEEGVGIARVLRRFPNGCPTFMLVSDLDHTMVRRKRRRVVRVARA
jgi:hypothetical protein